MITTPKALGWIPDRPDFRDFVFDPPVPINTPPSLPRLVWLPGAIDQFTLGSCVANAVASAIHYDRIKQKKLHAWSPSRLFLYYNARALQGWQDWDSGTFIRDAIKSVVQQGSVKEEDYPYDLSKFAEKPPQSIYDAAWHDKVLVYKRVPQTLEAMKACLASDLPFVAGFTVYSSFPWGGEQNGEVPYPNMTRDVAVGGHAVLVCGYDDDLRRFTFQNSWGENWGEYGRGTIPYSYLCHQDLASDFWMVSAVE